MTDWVTVEMPVDSNSSLTHQPGGDWQWGDDGGPQERTKRQSDVLANEKERNEWAYHVGAITAECANLGAQQAIAKGTEQVLSNVSQRSGDFFSPILGSLAIAAISLGMIGLHGTITSVRPFLNVVGNLWDPRTIVKIYKLLSSDDLAPGATDGNPFGPYEVATPFLYDESPPGAWDFTLIREADREQYIPVPSPCDGRVSEEGYNARAGNYTRVDCRNGSSWFFAHYRETAVSLGDRVKRGDNLGTQGTTGNSTGVHIHSVITPPNGSQRDRSLTKPLLDAYFEQVSASPSAATSPEISAFLDALAWAEGADYNTLVGGGTFNDYSRHPDIYNAALDSDAAGRYQFLEPTWRQYKRQLGLPDFSPASQDKAAIAILEENGVPELLAQGKVCDAFNAVGGVWASLPNNNYGQPQKNCEELEQRYERYL